MMKAIESYADSNLLKDLNRVLRSKDPKAIRKRLLENSKVLNSSCSLEILRTLLRDALKYENEEIIQLIIKFIEISGLEAEFYKIEILLDAVTCGNVKISELVLKNERRLDYCPEWIWNNVFNYRKKSRVEMLTLLLNYGLSANIRTDAGLNLLHLFVQYYLHRGEENSDAAEVAEIFINSGIPVDDTDVNSNWTPLFYAIISQNIPLISMLIKKGADVNKQVRYTGIFPLHLATLHGPDVVDLLLSNGADICARSSFDKSSALHKACLHNNEQVISLLLRKGADIRVINNAGITPLNMLNSEKENYQGCLIVMVREFSKLFYANQPVFKSDMDFIAENSDAKRHFENCISELGRMSRNKFHVPFSYYSVLEMSKNNKKLAQLTKNVEFLRNFKENISGFTYFKNKLRRILREAMEVRDKSTAVELRLKFIFGDILPDIVTTKLAKNLSIEDLPDSEVADNKTVSPKKTKKTKQKIVKRTDFLQLASKVKLGKKMSASTKKFTVKKLTLAAQKPAAVTKIAVKKSKVEKDIKYKFYRR